MPKISLAFSCEGGLVFCCTAVQVLAAVSPSTLKVQSTGTGDRTASEAEKLLKMSLTRIPWSFAESANPTNLGLRAKNHANFEAVAEMVKNMVKFQ